MTRSGRRALAAPHFDPIVLDDLTDAAPEELVPRAVREGLRFSSATMSVADIEGAALSMSAIDGLRASELSARYAELAEVHIRSLDVPVVRASRGRWRDVSLEDSRLGSAELFDSTWNSVRFTRCRLGFVNLRGAQLTDVAFVDCTIDELDLGQSTITRFAAPGTQIRALDLTRSTLESVDLRDADIDGLSGLSSLGGAVISPMQLQQLAPLLAEAMGIRVLDRG